MIVYEVKYKITHPDGYASDHSVHVDQNELSWFLKKVRDSGGKVISVELIEGEEELKNEMQRLEQDMSYNGWYNRETWNVALWINNTESLYRAAVAYVKSKREKHEVKYSEFAKMTFAHNAMTGDRVKYHDKKLSLRELNDMLREMWEDFHEGRG